MKLGLNSLNVLLSKNCATSIKLILVLILACVSPKIKAQATEAELKKEAEQLFEDEEYTRAYKIYAQLVSNHPTEPVYNYRLGVCMIYSEPDKKKSFSYLNKAYANRQDLPKDVTFFLGKAYHINYLFDEAIKFYTEFKKEAPSSLQKKLQVDREIKACGNGKRLLSTLSDLEIITKKNLNESDYFRSYDINSIGGKLLVKPDDFKTSYDKKKKDKSIVYLPKGANKVFFSSYGSNNNNGKDLYYRERMSDGIFGEPIILDGLNTEFDEDYPFLHPNGKTLYFASKGHNSMGGYDIFKSTYNDITNSWSTPKNLEFPINSPDDDYLYVTDESEKIAYFSTARYSQPGKIDVLKIKTERKPIDVIVMKGTVAKESLKQSVRSKLTVKNISTDQLVGVFEADYDGNFTMDLPNGAKLLYTVETPGIKTQSQGINLPLATIGKPFKQTVTYVNEVLKIVNNFEEPPSDESYIQYLKIIEEKAKLSPNEGKNNLSDPNANTDPLATTKTTTTSVNTTNPSVNSESKTNPVNSKSLAIEAKANAQKLEKEAADLNQDAWDAKEIGNGKKIEASTKLKNANEALANAEAITNEVEKETATNSAIALKTEAENELKVANKLLAYSDKLEADSKNKISEAQLNKLYASELEKQANAKAITPESQKKTDEMQKQIASNSEKKNESENMYSDLKSAISDKEKELQKATSLVNRTNKEYNEIKNDITATETELENTKKKKQKAEITERLNTLKLEESKINKDLASYKEEEKVIENDLSQLKTELALTDKIKTETIAKVPTNQISPTNTSTANNNTPIANISAAKKLEEKYATKINVTDINDKDNITEANKQLVIYNKDIDGLIAKNKNDLVKTSNPETKKSISNELKSLEATKKQNQQSIANNTNRINELSKQIASTPANNKPNEGLKEINSSNPDKVLSQLSEIKNSLTQADNQVFNFNEYTNTDVQDQKIKADDKINEAYALQNKLKESITKSEEKIKASSVSLTKNSNNPDQLLQQAEDLQNKASKLRAESDQKQGAEKDKLVKEAVELEKQSEIKQIEASEASGKIAIEKSKINIENSQALMATNKSNEANLNNAKTLLEEADATFKQARAIREEANANSNTAAKIGNLSNAEEKEYLALQKQNEALDLLKKDNESVALKPYKNLNTVSITDENVVKEEVAKINEEVKQLVALKSNAYDILTSANEAELNGQSQLIQNNTTIQSTPNLTKQKNTIDQQLNEIATLKANVNNATNPTDKLVLQNNLVKKQNEALSSINKLNTESIALADKNIKAKETEIAKNTSTATTNVNANNSDNSNQSNANQSAKETNTTSVSNNTNTNPTAKESNSVASNSTSKETNATGASNSNSVSAEKEEGSSEPLSNEAKTAFSVDLSFENHKDTSINQISDYFAKNNITLTNTQAEAMKSGAISEINELITERKNLDEEIANATSQNTNAGSVTNKEIEKKIDDYILASENLATEANNLRMESSTKTGDEKEALVTQAKEMESKSFNKKVEASQLTMQFNEANYNANNNAIKDMLAKLKSSNPSKASELEASLTEIETNKVHSKKLREEANDLKNNSARFGAIGNAEEVEAGLLIDQNNLIAKLKADNPDYVVKEPTYSNINGTSDLPSNLKEKQNALNAKQLSSLTNLSNAFNLEYETNKNSIPQKLTPEQQKLKNNIEGLNTESKNLIVKSSTTNNFQEKTKLLTLAAKTGHAAASQLKVLNSNQSLKNIAAVNNNVKTNPSNTNTTAKTNPTANTNNTSKNNTVTNTKENTAKNNNNNTSTKENNVAKNNNSNTNPTKENNTTKAENNTNTNITKAKEPSINNNSSTPKVLARIEGLEVLSKDAYSDAKPIPVDSKIPDGLVFRVQIGAFKSQIPNNAFRGLTPINGETTTNGYIRYTAGNFNKMESANAVKGDLNKNGYPDAFVVVFFNGKRITLNEALAIMAAEGKTLNTNGPATAGISENVNPNGDNTPTKNTDNENVVVTKELEKTNNLLFTVQIGVYSKQISKARLNNLSPIYSEKLPNGLYRYTAGIYNNPDRLISDKNRVIDLGIKDAFVSAYLNGKRLPFNEAKTKKETDASIQFEPENPIQFPTNATVSESTPANTPAPTNNAPSVAPFKNNVTTQPAATPENGVKENEEGISFRVQIGAYSRQVPNEVADKFNNIKNWPIENKAINSLYIYNVGNFKDAKFAKQLKDEVVALGILDAFVTVYKDGVKLFGAAATEQLTK